MNWRCFFRFFCSCGSRNVSGWMWGKCRCFMANVASSWGLEVSNLPRSTDHPIETMLSLSGQLEGWSLNQNCDKLVVNNRFLLFFSKIHLSSFKCKFLLNKKLPLIIKLSLQLDFHDNHTPNIWRYPPSLPAAVMKTQFAKKTWHVTCLTSTYNRRLNKCLLGFFGEENPTVFYLGWMGWKWFSMWF